LRDWDRRGRHDFELRAELAHLLKQELQTRQEKTEKVAAEEFATV
jgi:hypothetical protein